MLSHLLGLSMTPAALGLGAPTLSCLSIIDQVQMRLELFFWREHQMSSSCKVYFLYFVAILACVLAVKWIFTSSWQGERKLLPKSVSHGLLVDISFSAFYLDALSANPTTVIAPATDFCPPFHVKLEPCCPLFSEETIVVHIDLDYL